MGTRMVWGTEESPLITLPHLEKVMVLVQIPFADPVFPSVCGGPREEGAPRWTVALTLDDGACTRKGACHFRTK